MLISSKKLRTCLFRKQGELLLKKFSATMSKIQSSRQVKRYLGFAILLGFEIILGAALAKFTESPILLVLLFGALTIAALVNIEYTFYL